MHSNGIYLLYNSIQIFLFVGRASDTFFLGQIFKVNDIQQLDKNISEEEIFADVESSSYLTALYSIINQMRAQRQPFCGLRVLLEGEPESEGIIAQMMVVDNRNAAYQYDFNKFLATMTSA